MATFTAKCGCVIDCWVNVWAGNGCCCGDCYNSYWGEYEVEDAEITELCDLHSGL